MYLQPDHRYHQARMLVDTNEKSAQRSTDELVQILLKKKRREPLIDNALQRALEIYEERRQSKYIIEALLIGIMPAPDHLNLGCAYVLGNRPLNGHIRRFTYFPARLSNAVLLQLVGSEKVDIPTATAYRAGVSPLVDLSYVQSDVTGILRSCLDSSSYGLMTAYTAAVDKMTYYSSGSAVYSAADKAIKFLVAGDIYQTSNLLDGAELGSGQTVAEATVVLLWKYGSIDTDPSVQLSQDGGTNWDTATLTRIGSTTGGYYAVVNFTATLATSPSLQLKVTSSVAGALLEGYGVYYGLQGASIISGVDKRETQTFDPSAGTTTFTLTKFVPTDKLKVYLVERGLVFRYGAFSLDNKNVIFPAGWIDNSGISETLTLVFDDQDVGAQFDSSDANGALLAANCLGSTDASLSRALPGRGILLKSPNGMLFEITVNDDGSITTYSRP